MTKPMSIEKIRERAIENLMLHKGFDRAPCEHIVDIVFNTEIAPERGCEKCSCYVATHPLCPECNGTGKLPPITVEQAIKEKLNGTK